MSPLLNHQSSIEELKEVIKDLVDPVSLLGFLGFDIKIKNSHELRAPCALHGGDNPTAFRMKLSSKRFSCYSHKCEYTGGRVDNDVFSLVMKAKGVSFPAAVEILSNFVGVSDSLESIQEARKQAFRRRHIEESIREVGAVSKKKLPEIDAETLDGFLLRPCGYFSSLGVPRNVQEFFELGSMVDSYGVERATVPIRDIDGRLVSVSARRTDGDKDPRYLLLRDFQKHLVLYNLNNAVSVLSAYDKCVVIVEGFKAAWSVHSAGFFNVVAAMGAVVSESQAALLSTAGFTRCILMLDGDVPGRKGSETSLPILSKYMRTTDARLYGDFPGMSPDDFDPESLRKLVEQAEKEVLEG